MDGGALYATVRGVVTKSQTRLSDFTFTFTYQIISFVNRDNFTSAFPISFLARLVCLALHFYFAEVGITIYYSFNPSKMHGFLASTFISSSMSSFHYSLLLKNPFLYKLYRLSLFTETSLQREQVRRPPLLFTCSGFSSRQTSVNKFRWLNSMDKALPILQYPSSLLQEHCWIKLIFAVLTRVPLCWFLMEGARSLHLLISRWGPGLTSGSWGPQSLPADTVLQGQSPVHPTPNTDRKNYYSSPSRRHRWGPLKVRVRCTGRNGACANSLQYLLNFAVKDAVKKWSWFIF